MEDLRYPVGPFTAAEHPDGAMRKAWIGEIAALPEQLRLAVQNLTEEQLDAPYRPGGWSVRQVIHHMADNDMNAYIRFKRGLTEDSPVAGYYAGEQWGELTDYEGPLEPSLVIMEALRVRFVPLLQTVDESQLQRTLISPTHGPMTLDVALQRYAWHGRHHLAHIVSLKIRSGW